ncbi:DUF1631 family protein [Acidovorax sp. CCYZU-2555]|uniref:DUF1631 family protein n=1 Tax=Acidovorax sp. CCYZU-2555 TaxID=2835042 RepID=UPI001BD1181C|nr:DUF1631 family protein [Acidovorax sp. CCYZU-2555]MBS7777431.1 DUF1631 domain-containing protein [Acidovorax sp. CCYZU-2555]
MASPPPPPAVPATGLVRQAREQLAQVLTQALPDLAARLEAFLEHLADQVGTQREMQANRAALERYRAHQAGWVQACRDKLQAALAGAGLSAPATRSNAAHADTFELLSDETIENQIQAARLALATDELAGSSFEGLRLRSQWLQHQELAADDLLRPETFCELLVNQWRAAGLPRADLHGLTAPLQSALGELLQGAAEALHKLYDDEGVPPADDLAVLRRNPDTAPAPLPAAAGQGKGPAGKPAGPMHPLLRARQRAQEVVQQLRHMLSPATRMPSSGTGSTEQASQSLLQALAEQGPGEARFYAELPAAPLSDMAPGSVDLDQLARTLRQRSHAWKQQATVPSDRAAIEVVALMFQSILAQDRIPPSVRVWFARLQLPVLRVALAEPEFFSNLQHPARLLIDRMGACVLGFDATSMGGSVLEAEIARLVQTIEQFPETGQRVFLLAHQEFEKFLASYLTQEQSKARIISLVQQMEEKETLTIQYTIELRRLLQGMPVRAELRNFLFRDWAEVLALSAVRMGAMHAQTQAFKQAASDLVWAGSAKPTREQRAQLIRSLPQLLQCLREGLTLVGMPTSMQAEQIKRLTDTLAEAFIAKTAAIAPEALEAMARRLSHLEDFMTGEGLPDDTPLSTENIEILLGVDIAGLEVLSSTAQPVDPTMLEWARALQPGSWFTLDHNGASVQVQYAWHSNQRQLHLFATLDGQCYLMPLQRLAIYLQSGLLLWHDAEAVTLRATRDALEKLEANPERLQA